MDFSNIDMSKLKSKKAENKQSGNIDEDTQDNHVKVKNVLSHHQLRRILSKLYLKKCYKSFFDEIKSFDNTFNEWKPYLLDG